ncbi:hypothetical protein LguiA_033501 [Lonicera macranthoides]
MLPHTQLQILSFFLNLFIGGNFNPVNFDFNDYHFATPNSQHPAVNLPNFVSPFGRVNIIATAVIIIITLLNIIVYKLRQLHEANFATTQQLEEANLGEKTSSHTHLASEKSLRRFSLPEILSATHNFDDSEVIGKGGFGKVYKGAIDDESVTVAIKRLNHTSKQGAVEFLTEIKMLLKFRHTNLISLIGYCDDRDEMILVYEYMDCGALADHIYKMDTSANNSVLSWVQRLKICIGAARGLEYLHTGTNVIHRDLKCSNILLDENLIAKVSDFGISKVGPTNQSSSHVSTKIKGTRGYVDPEYLLTHKLTKKSDVYSFGVVLFEVLSGRQVMDLTRPEEQWGLIFWAQHCIKEEDINKIVDPRLSCQILPNSLASFVKIANHCLHYRSKKRPTMAEVVASLECALALQERTDSSVFDRDLLSMGGDFGNQDIVDCSSEQLEVILSGSGVHHDGNQEIVDYSSKQQDVVYSDNGRHKYTISGNSRTKTTKITAFIKTMREAFGGKPQMSTGFSNLWRQKKKKKPLISDVSRSKELSIHFSGQDEPFLFSFNVVKIATEGFADRNKLGQGGFGPVYKGTLLWGEEIAVKRLSKNSRQGVMEFKNEITLIAKLQHRNLVRLLGCSIKGEEKLVIYEYMPNKGLDSFIFGVERLLIYEFVPNASPDHFIFDPVKRADMDWDRCYKIIGGVARGLLYLHEDSQFRIIHRDMKASNVLLDGEMNPKIADFGMARLLERDETQGNTYRIVGTYGYMAPEYAMHGQFSVKSDVFSFGVLVLEMVSGQRNCLRNGKNREDLLSYAWKNWKERGGKNLIDPILRSNSSPIHDIMRCIHIGLLCVQENPTDRPTMASIVLMLSSFSLSLPVPSEPAFFMHSSVVDPEKPLYGEYNSGTSESSEWKNASAKVSINDASVSELYPR